MESILNLIEPNKNNFVFLGEAGSGKSEIALNFAMMLRKSTDKTIHFFDLDMTKPLFRSRDTVEAIESSGIVFHYEEQFMDAPTLVGGVTRLLRDDTCLVVMDVGGDAIGARAVGGFSNVLNQKASNVYYVLNAFRPWSLGMDHIDETLASILGVSHVRLDNIKLINNPNLGVTTTLEDFFSGCDKMAEMVSPYKPIEFTCIHETLYEAALNQYNMPLMPIHLYLTYEWL